MGIRVSMYGVQGVRAWELGVYHLRRVSVRGGYGGVGATVSQFGVWGVQRLEIRVQGLGIRALGA